MSSRSSYTDYHKVNWDVVIKPISTTKPKLLRFFLIGVSIVLLGLLAYFLNKQLGFGSYEFFWIVFLFGAAVLIILGIFWGRLDQLIGGTKIYTYVLNFDGLTVNQNHHDFEEFEIDKLKKMISEKKLVSIEHDYYFSVTLPKHKLGQMVIYLPNKEVSTKFISSFEHYIQEYED